MAAAIGINTTGMRRLIGGKPELSGSPLPPAPPVAWGPCQVVGDGDSSEIPAGAQCGELTVPIDYSSRSRCRCRPAGLDPLPATGQKSDRFINPGGPGESGVDAAANMVESLPPDVRQRFDLVGFDPRGWLVDPGAALQFRRRERRGRADPQVDYSPAGVAHIEATEKQFVQRCVDKMGRNSSPMSGR